jgi:gliding motility-associated-like protein
VAPSATTTYTVSYAIPLSVCLPTTASATVTVTPQPTLSVNDTTICEGRSGTLTAIPSIPGGTYLWSSGGGTTQSITVSPLTTSTYTVAYTIAGCGTAVDSGIVTVLPLPALMVNDDTICQGQSATLTATPSRTGGVYTWTPSAGNTQSITVSPSTTTTYTVSYLLSGCNAVLDSGKVLVDIPYTLTGVSANICQYQSATISVTSSITGGNFVWTPGGATSATITVSPDSTTVYTAAYVIPQSVCPAVSLQDTVFVTPLPHVAISGDTICKGLSTVITAVPSQTGGAYLWTPGAATTQSINVTPAVSTDYIVAYTLAMCPAVYDTATITVTLPPTVSLSVQNGDCGVNDGSLWAVVSGGVPAYSYLWSDTLHTRTDTLTGLYANTTYTITVTDQSQCVVTASGTVGLTTIPLVIVEDTLADISCHGYNNGLIEIHAVSCPTCQYIWSNQQTTPTITDLSAGTYSVTVKDGFGCSDTASYIITDPVAATLGIMPIDTTVVEGAAVDLTNVFGPYPTSAITTYSWSPSVGLSCVDCPSPIFNSTAGTYHYTLVINYNQSCKVIDTVTILVESEHIVYIPNSFTPNGDGVNDVFLAFPRGVKFINLNIFDRWGELVFESQDEAHGWDGRFKGEMMPPGVYVYQTDITFNDGYTLHNKGSITLIR